MPGPKLTEEKRRELKAEIRKGVRAAPDKPLSEILKPLAARFGVSVEQARLYAAQIGLTGRRKKAAARSTNQKKKNAKKKGPPAGRRRIPGLVRLLRQKADAYRKLARQQFRRNQTLARECEEAAAKLLKAGI